MPEKVVVTSWQYDLSRRDKYFKSYAFIFRVIIFETAETNITSWRLYHHVVMIKNQIFLKTRKSSEIVSSFQNILNHLNRSYES